MTIIDSQVHAYEANTPKRPWHSVPNWPGHVTGDEMVAAMAKVNVDGAMTSASSEPWLADGLLWFAASPSLALALGETFARFRILAVLLLLGLARQVVSVALLLHSLRLGTALVVVPVGGGMQ